MNFMYILTICWVVPVAPMVITWMLDLPLALFILIWASGVLFLGVSWYYFFRTLRRAEE